MYPTILAKLTAACEERRVHVIRGVEVLHCTSTERRVWFLGRMVNGYDKGIAVPEFLEQPYHDASSTASHMCHKTILLNFHGYICPTRCVLRL